MPNTGVSVGMGSLVLIWRSGQERLRIPGAEGDLRRVMEGGLPQEGLEMRVEQGFGLSRGCMWGRVGLVDRMGLDPDAAGSGRRWMGRMVARSLPLSTQPGHGRCAPSAALLPHTGPESRQLH